MLVDVCLNKPRNMIKFANIGVLIDQTNITVLVLLTECF